jgi:outer membrane receptor protein involved in Fe transport
LQSAALGVLGPGLTRLPNGGSAYVLSLGNAGRATEWGGELSVGYPLSSRLTLEANAAYFRASVQRNTFVVGDTLLANSPTHMGNVTLSYRAPGGTDASVSTRLVESYAWRSGFYNGRVPARQVIDVVAGHQLSPRVRLQLVATNLLDQRRYEAFGARYCSSWNDAHHATNMMAPSTTPNTVAVPRPPRSSLRNMNGTTAMKTNSPAGM